MGVAVIDIPNELLRAVTLSWTMEHNHGVVESPFSGHAQVQRGLIERWSFTMSLRAMNRRDAQIAQAFFLALEGPVNLFRMHDPAACKPLGHGQGLATLSVDAKPGARFVRVQDYAYGTALMPGDWVQIGNQLCKVRNTVVARAENQNPVLPPFGAPPDWEPELELQPGNATLEVWPRIMHSMPEGTRVKAHKAAGLFRMTSDLPAWDLDAARLRRPYQFKLNGVQCVLRGDEAPIPMGWT